MIIDIHGANVVVRKYDILTVGMAGAEVEFLFDDAWDDLAKIAVFRQCGISKDVALVGTTSTIPHEVLALEGIPVEIGVYGTNESDSVVIPTVWAETRPVQSGADPSGDESLPVTIPYYAQLAEAVNTLVADIENRLARGDFNGIYIGEEEPTDPNVMVWIKTDGYVDSKTALTAEQVSALDAMFQKCAYTANATAEYETFKKAFGLIEDVDTPDTPDTPDDPEVPEVPDSPDTPDTPEVSDELVTDGLLAYFDFRTATYNNAGSGGSTTIAATQGDGQLFAWAKDGVEVQDEYGIHFANARNNSYSQAGNTTATDIGTPMTLVMLTYGHVMAQGFLYATTGAKWSFKPQYNNASGSTAYATQQNGSAYNADSCDGYNFCVYRVDGNILTEIMDTSVATYNGDDIDGFSSWQTTVGIQMQNATTDGYYCTAAAIYNRALTDVEIEEVRAFMKTLEVA